MSKRDSKKPYSLGTVWRNPYLGSKFTEVLGNERRRIGFVWTHRDGRVVVMPSLGTHVWFNEEGEEWTMEEGALWLAKKRR